MLATPHSWLLVILLVILLIRLLLIEHDMLVLSFVSADAETCSWYPDQLMFMLGAGAKLRAAKHWQVLQKVPKPSCDPDPPFRDQADS